MFARLFLLITCLTCSLKPIFSQSTLIKVEKGEFVMGCTDEQKPDCDGDEYPIHAISLSDFLIGKYEVTQAEWESTMGDNPAMFQNCGSNCPIENIDWYSMLVYCNELTLNDPVLGVDHLVYFKDEALTLAWKLDDYKGSGDTAGDDVYLAMGRKGFRLPSEAEWEFAARGGNQSAGSRYAGGNVLTEVAWYDQNADNTTHPVGQLQANELGIYDLSGNVWEKVFDYYEDFEKFHLCDPFGPEKGSDRVNRGGAYRYQHDDCNNSSRYFNKPTRATSNIGFRIARYE